MWSIYHGPDLHWSKKLEEKGLSMDGCGYMRSWWVVRKFTEDRSNIFANYNIPYLISVVLLSVPVDPRPLPLSSSSSVQGSNKPIAKMSKIKSFVTMGLFIIDEFSFMNAEGEPTGQTLEPQGSQL